MTTTGPATLAQLDPYWYQTSLPAREDAANGAGDLPPTPAPTRVGDDQDVHMRPRPFHTHPFLTAAGKAGHAHAGSHEPHDHNREAAPLEGRRYTDMADYMDMVRRIVKGAGTRVGESDVTWLAKLAELRGELETAISTAVAGLRHDEAAPASWTEIGDALGITRQSAQKRYAAVGGARTAGGQRSDWR